MKNIRLKQARKSEELTQKQLSEKLDISVRQYQYYESGEHTPTVIMAKKIADAVNKTIEEIFFSH